MKIIKKLFLLILLAFIALLLFSFGYYFAVTRKVALLPERLLLSDKTVVVYDVEGNTVQGAASSFKRQITPIEQIPKLTRQAFVDVEDRRFYQHDGYDLKGIIRASLHNLQAGRFKEGASTISQQLIKNTHLSQEKTVKRKLKEWKLTRELEDRYTKAEILEKYLNTIYFGHGCFGITSASDFYFGKTPSELTLSDSAILAGLVKSPNNYSPFRNPESCQKRKAVVLGIMQKNGSVTKEQKNAALLEPLPRTSRSQSNEGYCAFVFDELTVLSEKYDFKLGGNIRIYTYLDQDLQACLRSIADEYADSDKTILLLDGKTRGFKGCVSTVGNIRRLPGSLIKPLLSYAPAVEEDILSPATPILDEKINYAGYAPENYDGEYHGYVSARECVEKSLNIPAVKTLDALTVKKGVAYLERLGLPVEKEDQTLALALGGMKRGYPLRDLVAAYSTLQNGGVASECGFISSIQINGKTVYKKPTERHRVFSEETAYLATDMLKSTAQKGTAKKLRSLPFPVAAKTGTVGTKTGNTDAYALSYTPLDCAAVWLGNADNSPVNCTGGGAPCNLLYKINAALYDHYQEKGSTVPDFQTPPNVSRVELSAIDYYDTHTLSLSDDCAPNEYRFSEWFKNSAIPLNKSISFSNPQISAPLLSLADGRVTITFDGGYPTYYTYKIDRYDYATHTTLYEGELPFAVVDDGLSPDANYVYTVTPYYRHHAGTPVVLPTVTTKGIKKEKEETLPKDWWKD